MDFFLLNCASCVTIVSNNHMSLQGPRHNTLNAISSAMPCIWFCVNHGQQQNLGNDSCAVKTWRLRPYVKTCICLQVCWAFASQTVAQDYLLRLLLSFFLMIPILYVWHCHAFKSGVWFQPHLISAYNGLWHPVSSKDGSHPVASVTDAFEYAYTAGRKLFMLCIDSNLVSEDCVTYL